MAEPTPLENSSAIVMIVLFVIGQAIASIVWLTRLGSRVDAIEQDRKRAIRDNDQSHYQLSERITTLDEHGSRGMAVLVDRVNNMFKRLERLEIRILSRIMPKLDDDD